MHACMGKQREKQQIKPKESYEKHYTLVSNTSNIDIIAVNILLYNANYIGIQLKTLISLLFVFSSWNMQNVAMMVMVMVIAM